jgi:phosphopantothenoylcysteine decarboxylase/phosphopantothenate--cysteine ligase
MREVQQNDAGRCKLSDQHAVPKVLLLMENRRILLGVTGGIAAYKSADLVRRLRDAGAEVRVVMTRGAQAFVTPLTFQAVSGNPVHTDLLDEQAEAGMGHIELARWADRVLVAPATANFMARLAHGLADDLLSTLCLATSAPVLLAPAMNQQMWAHEATRSNCKILQSRGVQLLGPDSGSQACGETGAGRMVEPASLVEAVMGSDPAVLQGYHVLISAGPTYEDIDPVRYVGNRSSGRMGFAVAEAARAAGARVSLVAGPVDLATPEGVDRTDVRSASEMQKAVLGLAATADVFISVAAVADYTPASPAAQKIKKGLPKQKLELVSTPDILAEVAALDDGPMTVGFAAETENLREHALGKLSSKGLDMIAANRVGLAGTGFESEDNEIDLLTPQGEIPLGRGSKRELARKLVGEVAARLRGNKTVETRSNKNTRPATGN